MPRFPTSLALDRRTLTRAALALAILAGVLTIGFYALFRPSPDNTFDVFYAAAASAWEGPVVFDTAHGAFVYTPVSLLFFYPYLAVDFHTALFLHRALGLGVALGYGLALSGFLARRRDVALTRVDRWLVVAFFVASLYPVVITVLAGPEIFLGAALGLGFLALERDEDDRAGVLWAGASLFKVFPALWGAYLLDRRRWRATVAAVATGVAATAVGVLVFGLDAYVRYFDFVTQNRVRISNFAGGASPDTEAVTPIRPLAQVFPATDPHVWPPVIFAVTLVAVLAVYRAVDGDTLDGRATHLLATVVGVAFVMPTTQDLDMYLVYGPLAVLLFVERRRFVHAVYAVGTVVFCYNFGREEIRVVSGALGDGFQGAVMAVAEPALSFASMPLWGLFVLFGGCLYRAYAEWDEERP